jgi:hypothetical protein
MTSTKPSFVSSVCVLVGLTVAIAAALTAQTGSPLNGTWTMNVANSKYNPPSGAPKSNVVVYQVNNVTVFGKK